MKRLLLLGISLLTYAISFAQHSLEKLWESDSVTLKGPESVLFDSISNSLLVSSMKSGSVVQMGLDGTVIKSDFITGLNTNKGSALLKNLFYTAEPTAVAVVDIDKALIVKRIPVDSAVNLNDVAINSKGVLYVSDTRAGKVYRIKKGKSSLYLDKMPGANGLLSVNKDLYVLTSTSFLKVDANKIVTTIADGFESGLDGVVMIAKNEFIISNYKGILYYVNTDGTKHILSDTRANNIMCNDISYDRKTKTLYVPSFGTNRIIAYKVN